MSNFKEERSSSSTNENTADDKNVCSNSNTVGQSGDEESSNKENGSLLGHYITKEYELLRLVLSHLTVRDLNSAARVCKTWASAADIIRRTRTKPHWLMWHFRRKGPHMNELPHKLFGEHFYSEPQLCLYFMTRCIFGTLVNCIRSKVPCPCGYSKKKCSLKEHRVVDYLRAQVRPDCPCVVVQGCGIVGTPHDLSRTMEIEEGNNGYSGLLLPKVPGMTVTYFQLDESQCSRLDMGCFDSEEMETITGISQSSPPIRCLLLFCRGMNTRAISNLVMALQNRQEQGIAVGGGFFESINLGNIPFTSTEKRHMAIFGIALSGEKILAASTILGSEVLDSNQVDEAMDELQACRLSSCDSVAFMFACVGRGRQWYNSRNVESASFRRHFPSTPLMGYFGNGEVGLKYLPEANPGPPPRKVARLLGPTLVHSYTTVIVYVALRGKATS